MKEELAPVATKSARPHFLLFDGLRALAALLIVALHLSSHTGADRTAGSGALLARLDVAVTIFFVISGFLLYRPFIVDHLAGRRSGATRAFYWRRALRILPAYWLMVTAAWLVFGSIAIHSVKDFVVVYGLFWPYSSAWVFQFLGIFTVWSLSVEVAFYVALPFYAGTMARLTARTTRRAEAELAGAIGVILVGFAVYSWIIWTRPAGSVSNQWLPAQMQYFGLGMLLAVVHASDNGAALAIGRRIGRHPAVCWTVALAAVCTSAWGIGLPHGNFFANLPADRHLAQEVLYSISAVALVLPAVFGDEIGLIRRLLANRAVQYIGIVSYGIFLWHDQWLQEINDTWHWSRHFPIAANLWLYVVVLSIATATAALSWHLAERPILRLKNRGPGRGPVAR